ncbi:MAG: nuclear transport factor 2 family protein [Flavobacteriales bacterium]|nr:nuclear transport factor 2 family protein [Flavobacteriales bacterium]
MKFLRPLLFFSLAGSAFFTNAQDTDSAADIARITAVLTDYIDGTANGDPAQVRRAFHPDFNLYTVNDADSLWIRSGAKYIDGIKVGEKNTRQGRIISIDVEHNAAMAKAEIAIPGWRIFTDYFLLLKYEGKWWIVQKSYTWREWPKGAVKE